MLKSLCDINIMQTWELYFTTSKYNLNNKNKLYQLNAF